MFLKLLGKSSSFGILSLPCFLLIIFLAKEASTFILCHGEFDLKVGEKRVLFSQVYSDEETESTRCTWDFKAPVNSHLQLDCTVNLASATCTSQSLDVYKNLNEAINVPELHCGSQTFTLKSSGNSLRLVHRRELQDSKGNFTCNIQVV